MAPQHKKKRAPMRCGKRCIKIVSRFKRCFNRPLRCFKMKKEQKKDARADASFFQWKLE